jgi:hypothetical protein
MAMTFLTTALALVLLGVCTAAAPCLTTNAAAAAVCQNQQRRPSVDGVREANGHEAHHYRGLGLTALTKEFCETTLWSDNRSMAVNEMRELVLVAMDLASTTVASAGAKARNVLRSSGGRGARIGTQSTRSGTV